ncbi:MAG: hypothetical protein GEU73_05120 [Chloroflexi bacterium]|nr:hypothetical protein [Chloroflexota bacterium]
MSRPITYCTINGCDERHYGKGFCRKHYLAQRVHGDPMVVLIERHDGCRVEGCGRPNHAKGYCRRHRHRFVRHGDALGGSQERDHAPPLDRLARRMVISERGCWEWQGSRDRFGYGYIGVDGAVPRVYRAAYELLVGPIPEGLELDHICENPPCFNPDHLEPVTHAENMRRTVRREVVI